MSNNSYIKDSFGNEIPLLDEHKNISLEVIMLYSEDKLTADDRSIVDAYALTDEMSRDALDGFALTGNSAKTRNTLGQMAKSIQTQTGASVIRQTSYKKTNFNWRKIAAAITVLVIVGAVSFYSAQYFQTDKLADNAVSKKQEIKKETAAVVPTETQEELPEFIDTITVEYLKDKQEAKAPEKRKKKENTSSASKDKKEASAKERGNLQKQDKSAITYIVETEEQPKVDVIEEVETTIASVGSGEIQADEDALSEQVANSLDQTSSKQASTISDFDAGLRKEPRPANSVMADGAARKQIIEESDEYETMIQPSPAAYPGGDMMMYKFIEKKKNYTAAMRAQNLNGTVTVSFDIEEDGRLTNVKVKNGINGLIDQDALRVVRSMPKWQAATENGNSVKSSRNVVVKYGE